MVMGALRSNGTDPDAIRAASRASYPSCRPGRRHPHPDYDLASQSDGDGGAQPRDQGRQRQRAGRRDHRRV
eukprot:4751851-Prymnesium_polylepis.1